MRGGAVGHDVVHVLLLAQVLLPLEGRGFDPVEPEERRAEPFTLKDLRGRASVSGHACYLLVRCIGAGL
eukprot:10730086-Lingulodinium_polyedra.AAC.1